MIKDTIKVEYIEKKTLADLRQCDNCDRVYAFSIVGINSTVGSACCMDCLHALSSELNGGFRKGKNGS